MKSLNISATGSWRPSSPGEHTFEVNDHADIAVELLLAVPMACEALSIGEFVAQTLADDPSPLPYLPQLKTLLLHCRKDFVGRSIRMVREQAARLPALTELVVRAVIDCSRSL